METKEFLTKILAEPDYYVACTIYNKIAKNISCSSVEDLAETVLNLDKTNADVYYAVGKHSEKGLRKKDTATYFKTLAADIDVGEEKAYKNQRAALLAVITAVVKCNFPQPLIVSSGNGLHIYYPLTKEIPRDEWEALSRAFAQALIAAGLTLDMTKVFEASMVLRPVGTHHKKDPQNWKLVECLQDAEAIDPEDFAKLFGVNIKSFTQLQNTPSANKKSSVMDALTGGEGDITKIPFEDIADCAQIAALVASAGASVDEPLWRASLGIAKYCEDSEAAIEAMASGYPEFDMAENLAKMHAWQGAGPPTCSYLESLNPEPCQGCKFQGKVKTPTALATNAGKTYKDPRFDDIHFPKWYSWDGHAITYKTPHMEHAEVVCSQLIYVVNQYSDSDRENTTIKLAIKYPVEGWVEVDMPHTALSTDGKEFNDFIYAKQVWVGHSQPKRLRAYLVSYLNELKQQHASGTIYDHYGWQNDGRFLLGNEVIGVTGSESIQYSRLAQQFSEKLQPHGDLAAWVDATKMFALDELTHHGFVFLIGLSGPLMVGAGIPGLLVNMYSPHSGSGKSLTGMFALSAWGNPDKLFLTTRDTDNAIYKTLGTLKSLSAYIDEITMVDLERLRKLLSAASQGKESTRGTRTMRELLEGATWEMPILSSSNQCLYTLLEQRISNQGDVARILQLPFHRQEVFNRGGTNLGYRVARTLQQNYGLAGKVIVSEIMRRGGKAWVSEAFHTALETFSKRFNVEFTGPDRFIQAGFVLADVAGKLCSELNLLNFDATASVQRAVNEFKEQRSVSSSSAMEGPEIINQFLTEHADQIIVNRDDRTTKRSFIREPVPRTAVARIEVISGADDVFAGGNLIINRSALRKWCLQNGLEYVQLLVQLKEQKVAFDDAMRMSLYRGVAGMGGVGQTRCLKIDMITHPIFMESGRLAIGQTPNVTAELLIKEVKNA